MRKRPTRLSKTGKQPLIRHAIVADMSNDHFREYLDRVCVDTYLVVERTRRIVDDTRALAIRTGHSRRATSEAVADSAAGRRRRAG